MASYYTYGEMPDAQSTVYGGGLDDDRAYVPRGENVPIAPLSEAAPAPAPARYDEKGNLLPSADSPLSQMSGGVPQWVKMRQLFGGTPSLIPDLVTAGSGGKDLTIGDLYKTKREQAVKDYEAKVQRFKDAGEYNPGIDESLKSLLNQQLESLAQEEVGYLNQLPQRQTLSNLLKENKFEEAYKFAQDNGMQMLLFRGDQLKDLREPFTKEEAKAFMRAMPYEFFKSAYGDQYEFEKAFKFDPEGAEKRGALNWVAFDQSGRPMIEETKEGVKAVQSETGYPALERIFELQEIKKDPGIFEKIFKVAAIGTALVGGAQLLGALSGGAGAAGAAGAGGAGAAGAGTAGAGAAGTGALTTFAPTAAVAQTGALAGTTAAGTTASGAGFLGGLKAAGKAVLGIPETIGKTVATQLGAGGLSPVYNKMIGNAIISGGVTGAKGGDLKDVLKSAALAAGLTYVSDAAISKVAQSLQDSRLMDAVKDIPGGDVAAVDPTVAANITSNVAQGLENFAGEFGVTTFAPSAAAGALQSLGAVGAAQAATSPAAAAPEKQFAPEEDLIAREFTIGAKAPQFGAGLETGAYTGYRLASDQGVGAEKPIYETTVSTEGDKLQPSDASDLAIQSIMNQMPFEPAPIDPLTGLQEITATTTPEGLDLTDPLAQVLVNRYIDVKPPEPVSDMEEFTIETDRDLNQGFLEYAPPIFTPVNPADIMKDYQPTQVKSKFDELLAKYGTLENLLKVLGSFGAAGAGAAKPTTGAGVGAGGMGGALPKYTYTRQQLSPDIDYYTYGTRPEAKFFEYGLQLEKPEQPAPPPPPAAIRNPEEEPVFATGGLTGYAKGGSKSSRYVDGPGSGRDDKIPALLSDGEYVIDAETLALLGDGSTKEGARRMDRFRANIRKHKGRALSRGRISPNAKSPDKYMGGGLT